MFSLILLLIFALGFGYFATFNTIAIPVVLGSYYAFPAVPLYTVIGVSLLIGLFLSWLITLVGTMGNHFTLRHKEREINVGKATIHTMTKNINDLQIENSNLKGELKNDPTDELTL